MSANIGVRLKRVRLSAANASVRLGTFDFLYGYVDAAELPDADQPDERVTLRDLALPR
ncbi:hypothetical protein GCM10023153_32780 [Ornithinibacter aureus]|uniref:Uncharacterized protein n=1 Tax=Ornithinibacter aureus TaxID=622664 RepID=A0ABP8KA64_9MICO|nr:hypothetical protein [Ornithinibacter aureus]